MTDLIPITRRELGGNAIPTCDARELHAFLEVGRDFTNWIKDRIEQYGFEDGRDFSPILAKSSGGRPSTEYAISLDMAKELAMVERNEKGRQARKYFIECERIAKGEQSRPAPDPLRVLNDPAAMRGLLLTYADKVIALEAKAEADAPKVAFARQVEIAPDAITTAQAAKIIGTGRTRFMSWLREIHWLDRRNQPYQEKIEAGLLDVKLGNWEHPDHGLRQSVTALVTGKGLVKLQAIWSEQQCIRRGTARPSQNLALA